MNITFDEREVSVPEHSSGGTCSPTSWQFGSVPVEVLVLIVGSRKFLRIFSPPWSPVAVDLCLEARSGTFKIPGHGTVTYEF